MANLQQNIIRDERHIFELVTSVPKGYKIWNIGKNMVDGYLPLCEVIDGYNINPDTLKAIKCDGAQTVLSAIGFGQDTVEKMESYIKRYRNAKGSVTLMKVERMKKAIEVLKTIKFD